MASFRAWNRCSGNEWLDFRRLGFVKSLKRAMTVALVLSLKREKRRQCLQIQFTRERHN
jgi:hypothetical protein